jgi:hypothetical protein
MDGGLRMARISNNAGKHPAAYAEAAEEARALLLYLVNPDVYDIPEIPSCLDPDTHEKLIERAKAIVEKMDTKPCVYCGDTMERKSSESLDEFKRRRACSRHGK